MKSVDEMIAEAQAYRTREYARLHQERTAAGLATIKLVQASDEPELFSTEYQTEFRDVRKALVDEGIETQAPFMVMDSVGGGGGYIGELVIPLVQIATPVVVGAIWAWFQNRSGRKIRLKFGENEIEVPTKKTFSKEEFGDLLQRMIDGAGHARAEKVESKDEWISAAEAASLLKSAFNSQQLAQMTICKRAHGGLIHARAERFMVDGVEHVLRDESGALQNIEIEKEFWWAEGNAALHQNWITGDFDTWIDNEIHLQAFNVWFLRADIEKMIPAGSAAQPVVLPSPPSPATGGRPPADWWDDLWIEICRQLYAGDLKPTKQSDIETAMLEWLAKEKGETPSTSTIRPRARKLWTAIQSDGEK
jgi:hypothetical protein